MAIARPKEAYHQRTSEQMEKFFRVPDWNARQKMALACRVSRKDSEVLE